MTNIHSLKNFKDKKVSEKVIKDLSKILEVVNLNIRGLTQYKHYIPVKRILVTMENEKAFLEAHLTKFTQVIEKNKNE